MSESSPTSNGALVRFVGRNRIKDGLLLKLVTGAKACLAPLLIADLVRARRCRKSWKDCLFQLYSLGSPPAEVSRALSEPRRAGHVRFVCITDTHMCHDQLTPLPEGDVLVHCGDFTNHGSLGEVKDFAQWIASQPHERKIVVPGNHDMIMDPVYYEKFWSDWSREKESHEQALLEFSSRGIELLVDATADVCGLRVHGSPWVSNYASWETAFNKHPDDLGRHWNDLPKDVDVLLTHMPPLGIGDRGEQGERCGCPHLAARVAELAPKLHAFGHIHSDFGIFRHAEATAEAVAAATTTYVNAASVSDSYLFGSRCAIVVDVPQNA